MARNVALYPWFTALRSLIFSQAVWFLYFQSTLSAAEAVLLYAVADIGATALEVPSGYMSDRLGRRITLIIATVAGLAGLVLLATGTTFAVFFAAQFLIGAGHAFLSGTNSALLYESLAADGRADDIERHEVIAWRAGFVALAVSAVIGGVLALYDLSWPYWAAAVAMALCLFVTLRFAEPPRDADTVLHTAEIGTADDRPRLSALRSAIGDPVLRWLFVLSLLMYVFSHVPFVFGQPFILEALTTHGLDAQAPLVSGMVTGVMMLLSVVASLMAPRLRARIGLVPMLLIAFGMQIALCAVLALTNSALAIAFLFLRMVPNSLSGPFITARIQPLLRGEARATYLSLQSFAGRLLFAITLITVSVNTTDVGLLPYAEIRVVLGLYVAFGLAIFAALLFWSRRIAVAPTPSGPARLP